MRRVIALLLLSPTIALACPDFARAPGSRWSVTWRDGAAWLLTPCGDPFISIGVNTVDAGVAASDGRAPYHWRRASPDFAAWLGATRARVADWGFNTAGATSLPPDVLALPAVPDLELGRTARFHWVDPFHARTAARMRETARRLVRPYAGSAYRIGYFSDNEVGWWSGALFAFYLERPAENRTKRRLVALLRAHYGHDWGRFTRDFVPSPGSKSFKDLRRGQTAPFLRPGGAGMRVVQRWTGVVARRYYRLVHDALRAADPDALVFGDRLPIYYDPAAVRAMAPWVDAIATNYNVDSPDGWIAPYYFAGLRRLAREKPILVSEWFFAAAENRTGNRNNGHLMTVGTQAERARGAAAAAEWFVREPSVIGAHWFQYYDHPRGGRADGEDYNFGLVDVDDRPYEELIGALRRVHAVVRPLHGVPRARPASREGIPRASIDVDDRSLGDWPKDGALVDLQTSPHRGVPFADVLAAWDADGIVLGLVGMDYHAPELLPVGAELPHAECFHLDVGIDAGAGPRRVAVYVVPPPRTADEQYVMRADLCGTDGGGCDAVPGGRLTYFGADQPRVTLEVRLPWSALGVATAPATVRTAIGVTGFHRGRWISSTGSPPPLVLRDPTGWRESRLLGSE